MILPRSLTHGTMNKPMANSSRMWTLDRRIIKHDLL